MIEGAARGRKLEGDCAEGGITKLATLLVGVGGLGCPCGRGGGAGFVGEVMGGLEVGQAQTACRLLHI